MTGGADRMAFAVAGGCMALAALLGAEEPAKKAAEPERPRLQFDPASHPDSDTNHFAWPDRQNLFGYFSGHVSWSYTVRGRAVKLLADRMMIHVRAQPRGDRVGERAGDGRQEKGPEGKVASEKDSRARNSTEKDSKDHEAAAPAGLDLREWRDFAFYAEGARIEIPSLKTSLEADSLYYEHATGRAVARGARLKTTVASATRIPGVLDSKSWRQGLEALDEPVTAKPGSGKNLLRSPLSLHARVLRLRDFELFDGEGIEVSSCDFGVPHFALRSERAQVRPAGEEEEPSGARAGKPRAEEIERAPTEDTRKDAAEAEGLDHRDFIIDPEHTWFDLYGHDVVPLPIGEWDTRWNTQLPIRSVRPGHSGQFGFFGEVDWNLNYFLSLVPPGRFLPLEIARDVDLGFRSDYFERRGFGYGPDASYGRNPRGWGPWQLQLHEWSYYGEAQYYSIDDHGDEDRSTRRPVPRDIRYWGHAWHRQSIPYAGLFDLEYSKLSDSAYLGEYFERIAKEEKEQETLAYWRRNVSDDLAVTGLYQTRVNDFQTQTERLPEGKLFLLEQPVFETGLTTDLALQAAYLHRLEDDARGIPPRGFDREDLLSEWAYPVHLFSPWLEARPFALLRFTQYGEVLDEAEGSEDRASFGAGVAVSQHWSRVYRFGPGSFPQRLFGISSMKHVISPKVTYSNLFANDLAPEKTIPIDATDTVDLEESISFSLRNEILTRSPLGGKKPQKVKPLLGNRDTELETVPLETRRLLDSKVSFALFPQPLRDNGGDRSSLLIFDNTVSLIPQLSLRGWFELDPNRDFRDERTDASATYEAIPGKLSFTVGDRFTRSRSNVGYTLLNWTMTENWNVDAYYARDFERQRDVEYVFTLNRIFHRVVLSLEYQLDVGEDRNSTVSVNLMPVELLRPARHGHRR